MKQIKLIFSLVFISIGVIACGFNPAMQLLLTNSNVTGGYVNGDYEYNNFTGWDTQARSGEISLVEYGNNSYSRMTFQPIYDYVKDWIVDNYTPTAEQIETYDLTPGKRSEIRNTQDYGQGSWNGYEGTTAWYSWRFRLVDVPAVDGGFIMTQFMHSAPAGSPSITFSINNGNLLIGNNILISENNSYHIPIVSYAEEDRIPIQNGVWYTIKTRIRWSTEADGDVYVELKEGDGAFTPLVHVNTDNIITLKNLNGVYNRHYIKFGIYDSGYNVRDHIMPDNSISIQPLGIDPSAYSNIYDTYSNISISVDFDDLQVAETEDGLKY